MAIAKLRSPTRTKHATKHGAITQKPSSRSAVDAYSGVEASVIEAPHTRSWTRKAKLRDDALRTSSKEISARKKKLSRARVKKEVEITKAEPVEFASSLTSEGRIKKSKGPNAKSRRSRKQRSSFSVKKIGELYSSTNGDLSVSARTEEVKSTLEKEAETTSKGLMTVGTDANVDKVIEEHPAPLVEDDPSKQTKSWQEEVETSDSRANTPTKPPKKRIENLINRLSTPKYGVPERKYQPLMRRTSRSFNRKIPSSIKKAHEKTMKKFSERKLKRADLQSFIDRMSTPKHLHTNQIEENNKKVGRIIWPELELWQSQMGYGKAVAT